MLEQLDVDPAGDAFDDRALVRAMLDVESGLARALSRAGLVAPDHGKEVTAALAELEVDPDELGRAAVASGNLVVPLVRLAVEAVRGPARAAVHLGATSQDVMDSAVMLCVARSLPPLSAHLDRACDTATQLATAHRDTLMVARTLGQPAVPTTFGAKAAGWLTGLQAARRQVDTLEPSVQLGGAAGTLAAYGDDGLQVMALLANELGLADPQVPWHTERSRVHAVADTAAGVVIAAGKVATDVLLMSQPEVGEVSEGNPGGSSAMPHKQNPVASVLLVSAARRAPGLVQQVLAAGLHEHERATGSWHAEWVPLRDIVRLACGAAARVADLLHGLEVHPDALRRNLEAAGPGVMAEAYAAGLVASHGREQAQQAAREAVAEVLRGERPASSLGNPADYLGSAGALVDRAATPAAQEPE